MSDILLDATATSNTINFVDADLSKISVRSSESWCKASVIGSSIVISVESNSSYDERSAIITVSDSEDGTTSNLKVTQKQNNAILVDKPTYEVGEEGGVVEIGVRSNVVYNVEIVNADWITRVHSTRGLENSVITLNVDKNTSGDIREATVKIADSVSGELSYVTIKQSLTPYFSIDKTSIAFDENGGEDEITVKSNVEINTGLNDNWVEIVEQSQNADIIVYKLKVKSMDDTEKSRSTYITFKNTKWNISDTLSVSQTKSLYIDDSDLELYVDESISLTYVYNGNGELKWESSDNSVVKVDNTGMVTGVSIGSAIITVTSADGRHTDKKTITVENILDKFSCSFNMGWKSEVSDYSSFAGYFLRCTLSNNSSRGIMLTKCDIYQGNTLIGTQDFVYLGAKDTENVEVRSQNSISGIYTFIWVFTFNGKSYALKCDSPYYF